MFVTDQSIHPHFPKKAMFGINFTNSPKVTLGKTMGRVMHIQDLTEPFASEHFIQLKS